MSYLSRVTRTFTFFAAILLSLGFPFQSQGMAQETKSGNWGKVLGGIATAMGSANNVVGAWQGGKTENNPFGGNYLNLTFRFNFLADGSYQEAAYMGGTQVMFAQGTYQTSGSSMVFVPQQCQFSSEQFRPLVKLFPIPTDSTAEEMVSYSPLAGGGQLSLKDRDSREDWGLKPFRSY